LNHYDSTNPVNIYCACFVLNCLRFNSIVSCPIDRYIMINWHFIYSLKYTNQIYFLCSSMTFFSLLCLLVNAERVVYFFYNVFVVLYHVKWKFKRLWMINIIVFIKIYCALSHRQNIRTTKKNLIFRIGIKWKCLQPKTQRWVNWTAIKFVLKES